MAESLSKEQIKEIKEQMNGIISVSENSEGYMDTLLKLLALPDGQFEILAPGVIQSYEQSINNPIDKIALVQAFNANGSKAEDIIESFDTIMESIDKISLSRAKRDFIKQLVGILANAINDTEGISKRLVPVAIELCNENAKIPQYAHITDSGVDVYAIEDITLHPCETKQIPVGFKVALPVGFELQVRPKSGRSMRSKLRVANTPGTIDQGYRDEVCILLENIDAPIKDITYNFDSQGKPIITSILKGEDITISKGEKICQLVLAESPKIAWYRVEQVEEIGENRGGGFGSTGLK